MTRKMRIYVPSDRVIGAIFNLSVEDREETLGFIFLGVDFIDNNRILPSLMILM